MRAGFSGVGMEKASLVRVQTRFFIQTPSQEKAGCGLEYGLLSKDISVPKFRNVQDLIMSTKKQPIDCKEGMYMLTRARSTFLDFKKKQNVLVTDDV